MGSALYLAIAPTQAQPSLDQGTGEFSSYKPLMMSQGAAGDLLVGERHEQVLLLADGF